MRSYVKKLGKQDIERIMNLEKKIFMPSIQATKEIIERRFDKNHVYLGVFKDSEMVGTLGLRFAKFTPNFVDFIKKYPSFEDYAEKENDSKANASFVYSVGVIPNKRNGFSAKKLLLESLNITKSKKLPFLVGDARIPSYNGSGENNPYENFEKNDDVRNAINSYLKTGILPSTDLIKKDHVAGFYLKIIPNLKILGITDKNFWKGDYPCGGHMIIEYSEVLKNDKRLF